MAIRRPLYIDNNGQFRDMTSIEVEQIKRKAVAEWIKSGGQLSVADTAGATPTVVGVVEGSVANGTIDISSIGLQSGDVILVTAYANEQNTTAGGGLFRFQILPGIGSFGTPDGFVSISSTRDNQTGGVQDLAYSVNAKFVGEIVDTSISVKTSVAMNYIIMGIRGVDRDNIGLDFAGFDVARVEANGASSTPNPGSITTVTDNCLVTAVMFIDQDNATPTAPTGYTLQGWIHTSNSSTGFTGGAQSGTSAIATKLVTSAGLEDPGTFSGSFSDGWVCVTMAFRPGRTNTGTPLSALFDTRMIAGEGLTRYGDGSGGNSGANEYPSDADTNISEYEIMFQRVSQVDGGSAPTNSMPLYKDSAGNNYAIRSMNLTDVLDTFIKPQVDKIVAGDITGGTYTIDQSQSIANHDLVDSSPIFVDTRADSTVYTAAEIFEQQDQPLAITSYYLHINNSFVDSGDIYRQPAYLKYTPSPPANQERYDIQTYTRSSFNTILANSFKYTVNNVAGYKLVYDFDSAGGAGANQGTGIVNTKLNGSGTIETLQVGANDYRKQEFPDGASTTVWTKYLKLRNE